MNKKTILICAAMMGCATAFGSGTKELTLGTGDGLPCELTLVEIPKSGDAAGFAMSKREITQQQYERIMGKPVPVGRNAQQPVNNVTQSEAGKFCDRLNELVKRLNLKWTLPTSNQLLRAAQSGMGTNGLRVAVVDTGHADSPNVLAQKLQSCDFLLNKDFKRNAKYYLCLFSASWCGPCRREMPRIAKTYAEQLKADPDIELIHFSCDQNDEKALAWAKEHDVQFPVVKPKGGNPLDLHSRGIPHLFIVKADGVLLSEGHPARLFTDDNLRSLKAGTFSASANAPKVETSTEKTRKAIAKLFPGWSLDTEVLDHPPAGFHACYRGQDNVVCVHPKSKETSAIISRTVTLSGKNPCLFLKMASWLEESDFLLAVRVNGKDALANRLICTQNHEPWEDIVVSLVEWCGQKVKIEIVLTANDWYWENPMLARLEIAEGKGDMRIVEGKTIVDGYTWSYRAQNGEATIIAETNGNFLCAVSPCPMGHLKIPATLGGAKVTRIGRRAFADCSAVTAVTIPEGVTRIGRGAFQGCSGLGSVTIPPTVTIIEWDAFGACGALSSVAIPSSVKIIERGAFYACRALAEVTIPVGVTSIERDTFIWCNGLKSVTIPVGVTDIGFQAFRDCKALTSVTIPEGVIHIGGNAFGWCDALSSVTIPEGVTDVGCQAFRGCNALTSVKIPASVANIGWTAFCDMGALTSFCVDEGNRAYKSENGLLLTKDGATLVWGVNGDVTIPASVTNIGVCAFEGHTALRSVEIPSGVKSIGDYSFKNCRALAAVTIPESVADIRTEAFFGCGSLTSVTLPASVTNSINPTAFNNCPNLKSVNVVKDGKVEAVALGELLKPQTPSRPRPLGRRTLRERRQQLEAEKAERQKKLETLQSKLTAMQNELNAMKEGTPAGK